MAVTAAMVKELREMTGAGMMDCKKALAATDGDMDKAVEFLREKGLAGATKKAGRIAAEGIVMTKVTADEKKAVVVEVNAETDFVAKNEKFQNYVSDVADQALNMGKGSVPDSCRGSVFPDLHHRREHEDPSFCSVSRGERFRCFLHPCRRQDRRSGRR